MTDGVFVSFFFSLLDGYKLTIEQLMTWRSVNGAYIVTWMLGFMGVQNALGFTILDLYVRERNTHGVIKEHGHRTQVSAICLSIWIIEFGGCEPQ